MPFEAVRDPLHDIRRELECLVVRAQDRVVSGFDQAGDQLLAADIQQGLVAPGGSDQHRCGGVGR